MNHSPDSSGAFANSETELQRALNAGLAALKQKDYATAIAQLEACQTSSNPATRLKAQMGLIKAYVHIERFEAAIALCQPLCEHANPQVQAWARQTLAELTNRTESTTSSGSAPPIQTVESVASTNAQTTDPTGFTPLADSTTNATQSTPPTDPAPADATGFTPLATSTPPNRQSTSASNRPNRSTNRPTSRPPRPTAPTTPQAPPQAQANQQLDQQVDQLGHQSSGALAASGWRNAGRAQKWSSLGKVDASGLWALQVGTLVLLFWLVRTLVQWMFGLWNWFSIRVNWLTGLPRLILPTDLTIPVLIGLAALILASPWLLDYLLRKHYGLKSISLADLERHSAEAGRLLKRLGNQRSVPALKLVPTAAPLSFTYGYLPRNARIVVSQGLLKLAEDEIATLLAAEMAHLRYWDFGVLSGLVLVAQLPYLIYWKVAAWGDRQRDRVLKTVAVIISSLSYGLFRLLRWAGLWLSRVRLYYSDRLATDLTGNPNGLSRALLKSAMGTAADIQQQKQTSALLESFDVLTPVGYRTALTFGSLNHGNTTPDASLLEWDRLNPHRRWLILNNAHPTLGERIQLLMQYAQHWRLKPEIEWRSASRNSQPNSRLLLQGAPFFGIPIGLAVALLLWAIGWVARNLGWLGLAWLAGDQSVLLACGLLGFSIGMLLRINAFFPDIRQSNLLVNPALTNLLTDPNALPLDSQPVQLTGNLIGRRGLQNWLYQDLMLHTPTGLIRLHYTSSLGWIGDLFPKALRPPALIDRTVTVRGWFRRGATPWIDVETIQTEYGRTLRSYHPIWSTVLAGVAALLAVYLILRGG
jgi:Zn-dependent protease with chaperone function